MPVLTDPVGIAAVGNKHVPHAWQVPQSLHHAMIECRVQAAWWPVAVAWWPDGLLLPVWGAQTVLLPTVIRESGWFQPKQLP